MAQVKSATPTKAAKVKAKPKESTASWQARMTKCEPMPGVDRGPEKAHGKAAQGDEGQVVAARRSNEGVGGSTPGAFDFSERRGDR